MIDVAEEKPGQFSKHLLLRELELMPDAVAYQFFNNILELEHRRAYAVNCYYIDSPYAAKNISSAPPEEVLFQFDAIDREQPLHFRIDNQ
jgi:hypothetical protein